MLDRPLLGQKTWDALDSYMKLAVTEYYQAPLASILPNVLAHFDLPDCYRVLVLPSASEQETRSDRLIVLT